MDNRFIFCKSLICDLRSWGTTTEGLLQTQVFSAWPVSNWWILGKYNINYGAFITAFAAMDIALDTVILCLPIPVIKNLHMTTRRKFTLVGVFWLGFFVSTQSACMTSSTNLSLVCYCRECAIVLLV